MKIGFIGLGQMGYPMFKNLVSESPNDLCIGYDKSQDLITTLQSRTELKNNVTNTLSELAECDVIITMLPNGTIVKNVLLGKNGLANLLQPNSIVIDMSSSSPTDTAHLAQTLSTKKIRLADAPVSGSIAKATNKTLSIMLGCAQQNKDEITPILLRMGSDIIYTGNVTTAHTMKSINNYVYAAGLLASSEALLMGQALGLNLSTLVDILNASSGRNVATETKLKQHMLEDGDFKAGFHLALMAKDLGIANELKIKTGFTPPLLQLCHHTWQQALKTLPTHADNTEIMLFLKQQLQHQPTEMNQEKKGIKT